MKPKKQIYTPQEKKKFLEILKKYAKEVENKNTRNSALNAKNLVWQKITSEFNSSPQTNLHRTPKQLRGLWMNLKQHRSDRSGSNLQIAHAIRGNESSMDSDNKLETVQSESPFLSEESPYIPNEESQVLSTVKVEPMSPINADLTENREPTPIAQNSTLTPNNNPHISQHQENLNEDNRSSNVEVKDLEIQLLREKLTLQRQENKNREARAAAIHNFEYQILMEKLREAKAKADLAELYLRRQNYYND